MAVGNALRAVLLDVNWNCHGGFPRSRKSDSSALSAAAQGCHGKGLLERLARTRSFDVEDGESRWEVARVLNLALSTTVRWLLSGKEQAASQRSLAPGTAARL
jgi:hypothetical protein